MKGFFAFIRTKKFVIHFLLSSVSALLILWIAFKLMGVYTNHGEMVEVPDFKGKTIYQLANFVEDKGVTYKIIDSIYEPKEKSGIVIRQDPENKTQVKYNRTVYLYVTSMLPPQIQMPKLVDRSLRQAASMIESYGLKLGKTKYVADPCKNCILKQLILGKEIAPGENIKKGTVIDLVVGKGETGEAIAVPVVTGISFCEAKSKLGANGLTVGAVIIDGSVKDTCSAFVYRQSPMGGPESRAGVGSSIDIYITNDKTKLNANKTDFDPDDSDDDAIPD
jgi:beta-lactam-binding protein with PASTA domain